MGCEMVNTLLSSPASRMHSKRTELILTVALRWRVTTRDINAECEDSKIPRRKGEGDVAIVAAEAVRYLATLPTCLVVFVSILNPVVF